MKTKTEAAKILLEVGWSWDEVKEVLEEDKIIIPNFLPYRDTYSPVGYGAYVNDYGGTYSVPAYDKGKGSDEWNWW